MALHLPARSPITPNGHALHPDWDRALKAFAAMYGTWVPVTYAAGNFTASGAMTWTVQEADQVTFAYTLMGKRLEVAFVIRAAAVGGVADAALMIAIPGKDASGNRLVAARDATELVAADDNGTPRTAKASVVAGGSVIAVTRLDGSNWTAGSNGVEGRIAFEVR